MKNIRNTLVENNIEFVVIKKDSNYVRTFMLKGVS